MGATRLAASLALAAAILVAPASVATAATSTAYAGTTADGGQWVGDVPSSWNGTILLYSHGFGPPVAMDAPSDQVKQALLDRGYALVGSSYVTGPQGSWWEMGSAVHDQFEALSHLKVAARLSPKHVIAVGTSMGGLISALEDEQSHSRLDGALTTCGLVEGAAEILNYQLDGQYTIAKLLAAAPIKLVRFSSTGDALVSAQAIDAAAQQAQQTPQGRARLGLAMAFLNVATWSSGAAAPPAPNDYQTQEQEQFQVEFGGGFTALDFVVFARAMMEAAAGKGNPQVGNASWTVNTDFARLLDRSSYAPQVHALYRAAGLNLSADLATLRAGADIRADDGAVRWFQQTSVATGNLGVPELDLHTISDQLIPVQAENYYRHLVDDAGKQELLRQAYVERVGHCNFSTSELVAGVLAVQHRVETERWDDVATTRSLQQSATSLGLDNAAFIQFHPRRLSGNTAPFDPAADGVRRR